jgi:hypothetical protein
MDTNKQDAARLRASLNQLLLEKQAEPVQAQIQAVRELLRSFSDVLNHRALGLVAYRYLSQEDHAAKLAAGKLPERFKLGAPGFSTADVHCTNCGALATVHPVWHDEFVCPGDWLIANNKNINKVLSDNIRATLFPHLESVC